MRCLKCGRETDQSFCENCRAVMEKYPVKPGAIILLPKDRSAAYIKRSVSRRTAIAPEVRISAQRKTIRRLTTAVASLLVLILFMGFALFRIVSGGDTRPVGQNYSSVTKAAEETTVPELQTEESTD